jgi:nucleotide-binding universal stress UspA family protein
MMNLRSSLNHHRQISGAVPDVIHRRPFRVVAGVDWSSGSLAAIREIGHLYTPDELVLVHAMPSSPLESRIRSENVRPPSHHALGTYHQQSSVAVARRSLAWVSTLMQKTISSTRREVCDVGAPAGVVLDQARTIGASLIVVGQRGVREGLDRTMGSVSHQICSNAHCSTLVVRKPQRTPRRILAIIQQTEDVIALQRWLRTFPFKETSDLTVLCLMPRPQRGEPIGPLSAQFWKDAAVNHARWLVDPMVRDLDGPSLRVTGRAVWGHPPIIIQEASNFDLLMLHGSDRTDRYTSRSGLPWRALLRLAPCSTLVVRTCS